MAAGSNTLGEMGKRGNVLGLDVVSAEAENGVAEIGVERAAGIEEIARLVGGRIGDGSGLWVRVGFGLGFRNGIRLGLGLEFLVGL